MTGTFVTGLMILAGDITGSMANYVSRCGAIGFGRLYIQGLSLYGLGL